MQTEFVWQVRVYYEDTDAGGVVYYANYLKYFERARTEWLRSLGFEQDQLLQQQRVVFAVTRVAVNYHRPARFNQCLSVHAQLAELGRASMQFAQKITDTDGVLLADATVSVACVDADRFHASALPPDVRQQLQLCLHKE